MNPKCKYCDQGDVPKVLDSDGVLSSVSGKIGTLQHAYDVNFWPCSNAIKTHDEYNDWMYECSRLIDVDPEPESIQGKELAVIVAIIQGYEKRIGR